MKRFTHLPQLVLGLAFSWSIPMAWAAQADTLPPQVWVLFLINALWTIAYDTQYAMVDRDDDVKLASNRLRSYSGVGINASLAYCNWPL